MNGTTSSITVCPSRTATRPTSRMLSPGKITAWRTRVARMAPVASATCNVLSANVVRAVSATPSMKTISPTVVARASAMEMTGASTSMSALRRGLSCHCPADTGTSSPLTFTSAPGTRNGPGLKGMRLDSRTSRGPDPSSTVTTKSSSTVSVSVTRAESTRTNTASRFPPSALAATTVVTVSGAGTSAIARTCGTSRSRSSTGRPVLVAIVPRRRMLSPGNTAPAPARIARILPDVSATWMVESPNVLRALSAIPSMNIFSPTGIASASATERIGKPMATATPMESPGVIVTSAVSIRDTTAESANNTVSTTT